MDKIVINRTETEGRIVVSGSEVADLARPAPDPDAPFGSALSRGGDSATMRPGRRGVRRGWLIFIGLLGSAGILGVLAWLHFAEAKTRPDGGRSAAPAAATPATTSDPAPARAAEGNQPVAPESARGVPEADASVQSPLKTLFESFKGRVLIVRDGDKQGSGALLSEDDEGQLIVTARHVIEQEKAGGSKQIAKEVLVVGFDTPALRGRVVGWHQTQDLALVWLPDRPGSVGFHQPILESGKIEVAEPVWTIGHPMGHTFSLSDGKVTRLPNGGLLQFNAPISSGNSGGPLFDLKGNLVGVVSFASDARRGDVAQNLNFAVCTDALVTTANWHLESVGTVKLAAFATRRRPRRPGRRREEGAGAVFTRTKSHSLCQAST